MQNCIGILSDTHGSLDERVLSVFREAKVSHILHAGDIGPLSLLARLETLAPVTAVLGNNDYNLSGAGISSRTRENIGGVRIEIIHDLKRTTFDGTKDVIVCGHTHRPINVVDPVSHTLIINPGSVSRPRVAEGPSVALLDISVPDKPTAHIIYLDEYEAALNVSNNTDCR